MSNSRVTLSAPNIALILVLFTVLGLEFWSGHKNRKEIEELNRIHEGEIVHIPNDMFGTDASSGESCVLTTTSVFHFGSVDEDKGVTGRYFSLTPARENKSDPGMSCLNGSYVKVTYEQYRTFISEEEMRTYLWQQVVAERQLVAGLLAEKYYGEKEFVVGPDERWITMVNLEPVPRREGSNMYLGYGDKCILSALGSGERQERGTTEDGRVLYEFTPTTNPIGEACPKGALFFD